MHNANSVTSQKNLAPRLRRAPRDWNTIRQTMMTAAGHAPSEDLVRAHASKVVDIKNCEDIGLPLGRLEDERWRVSSTAAKQRLGEAGLPYEGRRAGLVYSWPSILRAEGVDEATAAQATRETHPHLFEDLLDTCDAAALLGYKDASSIRKLVGSHQIPESSFIRFAARGVYRFRPAAIREIMKAILYGRIV